MAKYQSAGLRVAIHSSLLIFKDCWVAVQDSLPSATLLMTTASRMNKQIFLEILGIHKGIGEARLSFPHLAQRNLSYHPQEDIGRIWMGGKQGNYFNGHHCRRSRLGWHCSQ